MNADWRDPPQAPLLRTHLQAFVPLVIQEYLLGQRVLVFPRHDLAEIIAAHGDAILYRIPGRTARAVSALVEALAALAFAPGGVDFLDLHFEVPPRQALALLEEQGLRPSPGADIFVSPEPAAPVKLPHGSAGGHKPAPAPTFEQQFRREVTGGRDGQA